MGKEKWERWERMKRWERWERRKRWDNVGWDVEPYIEKIEKN